MNVPIIFFAFVVEKNERFTSYQFKDLIKLTFILDYVKGNLSLLFLLNTCIAVVYRQNAAL